MSHAREINVPAQDITRRRMLYGLAAFGAAACGCAGNKKSPVRAATLPDRQESATDDCVDRLHDICGGLLLFYVDNWRLPTNLDEMRTLPDVKEAPPFECPLSQRPYVYTPTGIRIPEKKLWVIVYCPTPAHAETRWAISITEPTPDKLPQTKVIRVPESFFVFRPAA